MRVRKQEKIRRAMVRKVATSRKSRNHKLTMKNKNYCSLQLPLISFISTEHDLLSFKILLCKSEGLKGRHFYDRPRVALNLAKPLPPVFSKPTVIN